MAIKFDVGHVYHTIKTLGVSVKDDGRHQISQKLGKDGVPDITPKEPLTFDGRDEGRFWFKRPDGSRVSGHKSHFDPEDAYNLGESEAKVKLNRARQARIEAEKELSRAAETLARTMRPAMKAAGSPKQPLVHEPARALKQVTGAGYVPVDPESRIEAIALFAEEAEKRQRREKEASVNELDAQDAEKKESESDD